jgi:hypothetical protein
MLSLRITLACYVAVAGATIATAQDAPSSAAAPDAKPAKVHKICRQEVDTGSIMPHSTCHTKEEWAAIEAANRQQVDQMSMHRGGGATGH